MTIPATAITIDGPTAWYVGPGTPLGWQVSNRPCDTCNSNGAFWSDDGRDHSLCPDCDGTGRHTFTLDVPCLCMTLPGCNGPYKGGPCGGTGTRTLAVHVVEVLGITEDNFNVWSARYLPDDAAVGKFAVRLAVHT